jgi:hypothetical protein
VAEALALHLKDKHNYPSQPVNFFSCLIILTKTLFDLKEEEESIMPKKSRAKATKASASGEIPEKPLVSPELSKEKNPPIESAEEDEDEGEDEEQDPFSDANHFFQYQKALNILIDYLNHSIEENITAFPPSDQKLFAHSDKKLILNAILESGFYDFCKYRIGLVAQSDASKTDEDFFKAMEEVQGEIDLLAYLLVHTRLAHRLLNFDLYLSLLRGGLFEDVLRVHEKIVTEMQEKKQKVNKESIKDLRVDNDLYI